MTKKQIIFPLSILTTLEKLQELIYIIQRDIQETCVETIEMPQKLNTLLYAIDNV